MTIHEVTRYYWVCEYCGQESYRGSDAKAWAEFAYRQHLKTNCTEYDPEEAA